LIVDDENNLRSLLSNFFKSKGYKTLEAESGERALEMLPVEKISVVLLDVQMSGMDGVETLKKIRAMNPKLGVVMATGTYSDERVKEALELGAYGYILKPFDFLYLELVVISRLLNAHIPLEP
jgi:DNA-binding NtrC family response regulator